MARVSKKQKKELKRKIALIMVLIIIVAAVCTGLYIYKTYYMDSPEGNKNPGTDTEVVTDGEISFHFMMMGNKYAGDAVYIKAGENDILIDAGSRESSVPTLKAYMDNYITDNKLEYVIATHADRDHISGFAASKGIFDLYECQTIIDFPITDKNTKTYQKYVAKRDAEVASGAKHFNALQCYNNEGNGAQRIYNLNEDGSLKMEVLYNYYYENHSPDENEYSVCLMFHHGTRKFLMTGDLEGDGEKRLVENNKLSQVELFKSGHHGSKTSNTEALLSVIKPKICVVTCVAGTDEYTSAIPNQFPTQAMIDHIAPYTDRVYVTTIGDIDFTGGEDFLPMNGNVVVKSQVGKDVFVECSNNNTLLKDTEWFKAKRIMPLAWAS